MNEQECGYRRIPIKSRNKNVYAIVDADVYETLNKVRWHLHTKGYARGSVKGKQIYMHNLVLPKKKGFVVDHINENKLNNRRKNLRHISNLENITRSKGRRVGKCKGVYFTKGKWAAYITRNTSIISLGRFKTEREAAIAYNVAARLLFGKLAFQNFRLSSLESSKEK